MNIKQLTAELLSQPWLVDEEWFRVFLENLSSFPDSVEGKKEKTGEVAASQYTQDNKTIGLVSITGPLFARPNFLTEYFGIGTTYPTIQKHIQAHLGNADIDSILLEVDSPGGVVTGVNALAAWIKEASAEKDINSYVSGLGASAAYWLMSSSSKITIDATARVGSIGVVASFYDPKEDSIIEIVNSASPNKRPDISTDAGKKVIVKELDALADVFIGTVADNRKVDIKTVKSDFGKGGCLVGEDALSAGMVDAVGFFSSCVDSEKAIARSTYTSSEKDDIPVHIKLQSDETQKNEEIMDVKTVKKEHPETYKEIQDSATASVQADLDAAISAKDALQVKLDAAKTANTDLTDRVLGLEKTDALRTEKELKTTADSMVAASLAKADLPERVHSKVANQLDHNKHMKDGALDRVAFQESIDAEIKDWEGTFADTGTSVLGASFPSDKTQTDGVDAEAEAAVLLAHLN